MYDRVKIVCAVLAIASLPIAPVAASAPDDVDVLLGSMNAVRTTDHLRPLHLDRRLCEIAYEHAVDMADRHYYAHVSPEGENPYQRMAAVNIPFRYAGENLAVDRNASTIFRDFLQSREHRSNMLERHYVRVGIASVPSSDGTIVVEDFSD